MDAPKNAHVFRGVAKKAWWLIYLRPDNARPDTCTILLSTDNQYSWREVYIRSRTQQGTSEQHTLSIIDILPGKKPATRKLVREMNIVTYDGRTLELIESPASFTLKKIQRIPQAQIENIRKPKPKRKSR